MPSRRIVVASLVAVLVASVGGAAPGPAPAVALAATGPVAEWTFDEPSGTVAKDVIGGLNGTLSGGVTRITGAVPQGTGALQFDGVDDLVTVANAPALEPHDNFTVRLWVKAPSAELGPWGVLVSKGDLGCDRGGSWEVDTAPRGGSGPYAIVNTDSQTLPYMSSLSGPNYEWWDQAWHQVTIIVDDAAGSTTVSIDGHTGTNAWLKPGEVLYSGTAVLSSLLRFGGPGSACSWRGPFKGAIDDIQLYDRALSQAEILADRGPVATTTELGMFLSSNFVEGAYVDSAYVDQGLTYRVHVTPWPASAGNIAWYRSRDGGPEQLFATTPLRIEDMAGYAFAYQGSGTLAPGAYTIRAAWQGADNWQPSTSPALPLTISKRPVAIKVAASPDAVLPGGSITLRAAVSVPSKITMAPTGTVEFHETTGGVDVLLGTGTLAWAGHENWYAATLPVSSLSAGRHTYVVRYGGTAALAAATASVSVVAGPQRSSVILSFTPNPVLNTQHTSAVAYLQTSSKGAVPGPLPAPTGTITFRAYPGGGVIGTVPVTADGVEQLQLPLYPAGTRQVTASYSGDANFDPSASAPATLTIVADIVQASGVGVAYSTFYPYVDGYRDTVAVKGTRGEPASVSIRIYSPAGKLVRSASIGLGSGAYSYAWNGRTSTGTMLSAGTYKVVQLLTDGAGVKLTVTSSVALSTKRLYWTTVTYTKNYTQIAQDGGWWFGWAFTLPSATAYKGLVLSLYGKALGSAAGFGPQDFSVCPYSSTWSPACVTRYGSIATYWTWRSVSGSSSKDRYGRSVRLYAWGGYGGAYAKYARVKVTYGILK